MSVTFEGYERRINQIKPVMDKYGIKDFEDAKRICNEKGFDAYDIVKGVQPIAFENAGWAYTLGAAIAIKKGCTKAADAAEAIGEGLQAFCIPGSVADQRKVGLATGISRRCCCAKRRNASASWRGMSRSRRRKEPSASRRTRTKPAKSPSASF